MKFIKKPCKVSTRQNFLQEMAWLIYSEKELPRCVRKTNILRLLDLKEKSQGKNVFQSNFFL